MKSLFNHIVIITVVIICATKSAISQFNIQNFSTRYWGSLDTNIRAVGIGYFPTPTQPGSAFEINTNLITSPYYSPGEVFHTNEPSGTTAWRMLSGNVLANEKFNITNPSGSNNISIGTVQSGHLNFITSGSQKMTILSGGNVGIGTASPAVKLDIAPADTNTGYGINGQTILHNWGVSNLFVGDFAGQSNVSTTNSGRANAFLGWRAGQGNTTGGENTFIGCLAGSNNIGRLNPNDLSDLAGSNNTYLGCESPRLAREWRVALS